MKIVFLSNYFSHHQRPLSDALAAYPDVEYCFVETTEMTEERRALGWGTHDKPAYVYQLDDRIRQNLVHADVVIAGSAPEALVKRALKAGAVVFRYSERPLKDGCEPLKFFPRLLRWRWQNPGDKSIYLLSAGAFSAGDYAKFGLFRRKAFKWGYFPPCKQYKNPDVLFSEKDAKELLWCGRYLDWKHPDDVISMATRLKADGCNFTIKMIGTGPMEYQLKQMIETAGLQQQIQLLGTMSPERVRDHMEHAGIFLFTSDKREGWGAVLNEAMNSGCAVVTSDAIGATPYLVKNGENGMAFPSKNVEDLSEIVKLLLQRPDKQRELGAAAYRTITELWNGEFAAMRLLQLSKAIMAGDKYPDLFADGPCSRAENIQESWHTK